MPRQFNDRLRPRSRAGFAVMRGLDAVGLARPLLRGVARRLPDMFAKRGPTVFRGYEPRAHDVFVACYPKSGNNWTMNLAVQIVHRGAANFGHVHELVAWPHAPLSELVVPLTAPMHTRSPTGLRVIKSQLPHPHTPYSERARYLITLRDPKDTMVSMYHFGNGLVRGVVADGFSLEDLYDMTIDGRAPLCWAEHTASWWALRERPNVLVLRFDEMKRDLRAAVERIAAHLEVALAPAELDAVVERCGFTWMKANEAKFAPPFPTFRGEDVVMMRKGAVGEAKTVLSLAQREALDLHYQRKLDALGSDLPYRELFLD